MQASKSNLIICILLSAGFLFRGQEENGIKSLTIGQPMPFFNLGKIEYFVKNTATLNDFKGKWLILDFWNKYCSACVASFHETNDLQRKYAGQVQFVLVGYEGSQYYGRTDAKSIRQLYEKYRIKQNLDLPVVYDSLVFRQFDIGACPYIVIIDDKGVVRGLTIALKDGEIRDLLEGKQPILNTAMNRQQRSDLNVSFDYTKPFLINGNGGADTSFRFRSILSPWDDQKPSVIPYDISSFGEKRKFQVLGAGVDLLYRYAYTGFYNISFENALYGKFSPLIINETGNNTILDTNEALARKLYCYSLIINEPGISENRLQKIIQRDLQNYFDLDINIESRSMPCWKLIATKDAKSKLKSKGGKPSLNAEHTGITMMNLPVKTLLGYIWRYYQSGPPLIDETRITGNIDFTMETVMTNFEDVKKGLQLRGLDLIKSETEMKVMVAKKSVSISR